MRLNAIRLTILSLKEAGVLRRFNVVPSRLDPWLLAVLVAVTRIPFFAKTLFEFDSVNYAIALFRFDLAQDTPHLPGYLLHIGIAKLLYAVVGDANLAYVLESFFLSIGSVLFVWWGVRYAAGRGAAFGAAVVWALNPIFWFYGCVATVYPHEAFFTAAVAAIAVRYCVDADRKRTRAALPMAMAAVIGIAGAARESSLFFLTPALIVMLWKVRAPLRVWLSSATVMIAVTAVWASVLFSFAGGLTKYIELTKTISGGVAYNSIFLSGTLSRHIDMIGKMLLYLVAGTAPLWSLLVYLLIRRPRETWRVIVRGLRAPAGKVMLTIALMPLAFYTLILYSKPGYLLNIFAAASVGTAILANRLCRAGIFGGIKWWTVAWSVVWVVFFIVPLPGKSVDEIQKQDSIAANAFDIQNRYPSLRGKLSASVVKLFSYASSSGIAASDEGNGATLRMLRSLHSPEDQQAIIATQWGQWGIFYRPKSFVYDVELLPDHPVVPVAGHDMIRTYDSDSVITMPPAVEDVILLMWNRHWAFPGVQGQVHLDSLPMPKYLNAWRITDKHFRLKLGNITFVK